MTKSVMWPISYFVVANGRSQMILSNSNDLTQIDCSNFFRNFWFWVLDTKLSKPWKYFELSLQIRFLNQMLRWFLTFQSIKVLPHGIIQVVGRLYSVSYWKSVTYWWLLTLSLMVSPVNPKPNSCPKFSADLKNCAYLS